MFLTKQQRRRKRLQKKSKSARTRAHVLRNIRNFFSRKRHVLNLPDEKKKWVLLTRGMTNWQNSQWLRHAKDKSSLEEVIKFFNLKKPAKI